MIKPILALLVCALPTFYLVTLASVFEWEHYVSILLAYLLFSFLALRVYQKSGPTSLLKSRSFMVVFKLFLIYRVLLLLAFAYLNFKPLPYNFIDSHHVLDLVSGIAVNILICEVLLGSFLLQTFDYLTHPNVFVCALMTVTYAGVHVLGLIALSAALVATSWLTKAVKSRFQ